ncbi:MAG: hypothetical protein IPN32_13200 [Deltaproteobacteria bacterium]|nr:hypothetical protein [Deltaproteobacteria bacterium]
MQAARAAGCRRLHEAGRSGRTAAARGPVLVAPHELARAEARGYVEGVERKRGPKPKQTAEQAELEKLRRDNERLREKLRKAEKIIEVQKTSEVLGLDSDDTEEPT